MKVKCLKRLISKLDPETEILVLDPEAGIFKVAKDGPKIVSFKDTDGEETQYLALNFDQETLDELGIEEQEEEF